MSNRVTLSASMLDSMLQAKGIRIPKKPCCGRPAPTMRYAQYLARLGYHGKFAINSGGVVTELCEIP